VDKFVRINCMQCLVGLRDTLHVVSENTVYNSQVLSGVFRYGTF